MTTNYTYKVTYLEHLKACAFVRVDDDSILYAHDNEMFVIMFAKGFCQAKSVGFYVE